MQYGAHLPLISFAGERWTLGRLTGFARAARDLGYEALCMNDHLVFPRPWIDGPVALAATVEHSGDMRLFTSIVNPVVRGPAATAKTLGAIDLLSGGRVVAGVGPGSSARDYAAAGVDFEERWKRLDEAVRAMRALWRSGEPPFAGKYYSTEGVLMEPGPATEAGPPIWIGSWGSEAGLRRVARLADGWLASAYNTTPAEFAAGREKLCAMLEERGRDRASFPNGLATMWTFVTEDAARARYMIDDVLAKMLNRPPEQIADRVFVGPAELCRERLRAYDAAGLQRVFVWPLADEIEQLELVMKSVAL